MPEKPKKDNKKRILIISTVGLIYDGITSVVVSYLEAMKPEVSKQFDFYVAATIHTEPSIRERLTRLGCRIVELPNRRSKTLKYFVTLRKAVSKYRIDIVHAHGNSATLAVDLMAAFLGGCKVRIAHSHNTRCDQVRADKLLRPLFNRLYTKGLACGADAGKWLYKDREFEVLANGRDPEKYMFNAGIRKEMREKYGIQENEIIIGHVGGFVEQKNHKFLIRIYRDFLKKHSDSKLYLIGVGPLKEQIEKDAEDLKERVFFIGATDYVEKYLQMMDLMLLPSLFEGLPLVAIEWQLNGLPCLIADTVSKECALCDLVHFVTLEKGTGEWVKAMEKTLDERKTSDRAANSDSAVKNAARKGFDIRVSADRLAQIYKNN